jgi:hypothetical protein
MTLRAQIAFDLSLTTGVNFFTLDDVDKGVLDNTEYVLGGDALIDVTEYLRSVQVDRGRSQTLEKFIAGQANISLDNRTRIFDPTYGPGPYFGQILPRKQLVLDVDGEELFSGFVEDWNFDYPANGFDAVAQVSATDGFAILAQQTMTAGTQTAELSGPRVTAVLDQAGWSSVKRDIGPGQSTLDADVVESTTNVLSYLQLVETSEFGALFIGRQGALTFRDRAELQAFTTGVTFGPTGIPYKDISVVWGTEEMKNTVSVTFTAAGPSQGPHSPRTPQHRRHTASWTRRSRRSCRVRWRRPHCRHGSSACTRSRNTGSTRSRSASTGSRGAEGERPRPRTRRRRHRWFHPVEHRVGDQPDRLH